jgi:hypothetical protein
MAPLAVKEPMWRPRWLSLPDRFIASRSVGKESEGTRYLLRTTAAVRGELRTVILTPWAEAAVAGRLI